MTTPESTTRWEQTLRPRNHKTPDLFLFCNTCKLRLNYVHVVATYIINFVNDLKWIELKLKESVISFYYAACSIY